MARPPLLLVAVGGTMGAGLRWAVLEATPEAVFPWPVLVVNLVGCALLGALLGPGTPRSTRLLVGTGLCGGLTTFSTFAVEVARLLRADDAPTAVAYIVASVVGGLAVAIAARATTGYRKSTAC